MTSRTKSDIISVLLCLPAVALVGYFVPILLGALVCATCFLVGVVRLVVRE